MFAFSARFSVCLHLSLYETRWAVESWDLTCNPDLPFLSLPVLFFIFTLPPTLQTLLGKGLRSLEHLLSPSAQTKIAFPTSQIAPYLLYPLIHFRMPLAQMQLCLLPLCKRVNTPECAPRIASLGLLQIDETVNLLSARTSWVMAVFSIWLSRTIKSTHVPGHLGQTSSCKITISSIDGCLTLMQKKSCFGSFIALTND